MSYQKASSSDARSQAEKTVSIARQHAVRQIVRYLSEWEGEVTYADIRGVGGEETFSAVQYLFKLNLLTRSSYGYYRLTLKEAA